MGVKVVAAAVPYEKIIISFQTFERLKESYEKTSDKCLICFEALTCTESLDNPSNKKILGIGCSRVSNANTDDKTQRAWNFAHKECMKEALKRGHCPFCREIISFKK